MPDIAPGEAARPRRRRKRPVPASAARSAHELDARTRAYRQFHLLRAALVSDLGARDPAELSAAKMAMVDRCAFITVALQAMETEALASHAATGKVELAAAYPALVDRMRRALVTLLPGLDRQAREVESVADYLKRIGEQEQAEAALAEAADEAVPEPEA